MKSVKEEKGSVSLLRWPWNILIYILLAVALRIFSIPVILILIGVQRRNNPHGMAEGYCLSRTRKRLFWVLWALCLLLVSAALAVTFATELQQEQSSRELMDYVTLAVSGGGSVLLFILAVYLGFTSVRDALFPAKSALARSIRGQLPYPDEAPPVEELFALVDNDLREHGQWFDAVGIGREWVLGDFANRIDRIRGIFTVDEFHTHSTQTGSRTSRTLQLILIDDRWQKSVTGFHSPKELQAAADCLALRAPDAARGKNGQYTGFWNMDESAQEEFEREFQQKQSRRMSGQMQQELLRGGAQDMILQQADGSVTSRVTPSLIEEQLRLCLMGEQSGFTLTASRPVEAGSRAFRTLACSAFTESGTEARTRLLLTPDIPAGGEGRAMVLVTDAGQAREILQGWLSRRVLSPESWEEQPLHAAAAAPVRQERQSHARLSLVLASGACENHTAFTQEDIRLAAQGMVSGAYQLVDLTLPNGFLWIQVKAGDKMDGRCTVKASRPDADKLRFFSAKASPRQAAGWLAAYADQKFLPGGREWKDDTKQMEKSGRR